MTTYGDIQNRNASYEAIRVTGENLDDLAEFVSNGAATRQSRHFGTYRTYASDLLNSMGSEARPGVRNGDWVLKSVALDQVKTLHVASPEVFGVRYFDLGGRPPMSYPLGKHPDQIINSSYPVPLDILPGRPLMSDTCHADHLQALAAKTADDIQAIVAEHLPPPSVEDGGPPVFGAFSLDYKSLAKSLAKSLIPLVLQAALSQLPAGTGIDGAALTAAIVAQLDKVLS